MASKLIAVFLMCIVVASTMQLSNANLADEYKQCFTKCETDCKGRGQGSTFCEMKCDADCVAKQTAAKLDDVLHA